MVTLDRYTLTHYAGPMANWRVVPGLPLLVSDEGEVCSGVKMFAFPLRADPNIKGYLRVRVVIDGVRYRYFVHHLVLRAFVGPRLPGMETNHDDFDKTNNRLSNLAYVTQKENSDHYLATL